MLKINQLSYSLNHQRLLDSISFYVAPGETVGIIGPNGSGKTTLFNCISGFSVPSSGEIIFEGKNITGLEANQRAVLGIGRVFQNFGIFRDLTLEENIFVALEGRTGLVSSLLKFGAKDQEMLERCREILAEISLDQRAGDKAGVLSGGQMRLLEIMRSLAFGAKLFLLDEPTAGVAPKMKTDIALLIDKLHQQGKTILIIEHDLGFIEKFSDRILVLDQGRIVLDDTPRKVRENKLLQEIYFGAA